MDCGYELCPAWRQLNAEVCQLRIERDELRAEVEGHDRLLEMQRRRMGSAKKAWQEAHGKPDTWPDLGELIEWLMSQRAEIDRAARELLAVAHDGASEERWAEVRDAVEAALEAR